VTAATSTEAGVRGRRSFTPEDVEARRRDLVEATLEAIATSGLQGATVREIAMLAGVTPGMIRHYFTSKERMVHEAYREIMETMLKNAIAAADNSGTEPRDCLRAYLLACFRPPIIDPRNLTLWATFISQLSMDAELAAIHRETYLTSRDKLQEYIVGTLQSDGREVTPAEARRLSIAVNGLIDGLWLEGSMAPDLFEPDELADSALRSVELLLGLSLGRTS